MPNPAPDTTDAGTKRAPGRMRPGARSICPQADQAFAHSSHVQSAGCAAVLSWQHSFVQSGGQLVFCEQPTAPKDAHIANAVAQIRIVTRRKNPLFFISCLQSETYTPGHDRPYPARWRF